MNKNVRTYSIQQREDGQGIDIIDQRLLPHRFECRHLSTVAHVTQAIEEMWVRGAPLIGLVGAYGLAFAMRDDPSDAHLEVARQRLLQTRPTAVDLEWALDKISERLLQAAGHKRFTLAMEHAAAMVKDNATACKAIGIHGLQILKSIKKDRGQSIQIMTHCNAGWLATADWGTALAPIYLAHASGIDVHVWVSETRPRNQGAQLTAWELQQRGVPCTVVVDNMAGHLMQHGMVDICLVGADRVTARGDVCNKIGTYLKALAAHDNNVPFYAALPQSTMDPSIDDGVQEITIEQRSQDEVHWVYGAVAEDSLDEECTDRVRVTPPDMVARNDAFDVTPARLVTGLITENGVIDVG